MKELATLSLFDATTAQHTTTGIAAGASATFYLWFPNTIITNSFFFLPAINAQAPVRLCLCMNGGNQMFTTAAQGLTLNSISLLVSGIKYEREVRDELMRVHRSGTFVSKCETWQFQRFPLGSTLSANTQIQQLLQGMNGECSSLFFFIRPSLLNGSTQYGSNVLENTIQISQISQLTDEYGSNALTQNLDEIIPRVLYPLDLYPGSFRNYYLYVIPFALQPHLASSKSSDIGYLKINGNNLLVLTTGAAPSVPGPYKLFIGARMKSFITLDKDGNAQVNLL